MYENFYKLNNSPFRLSPDPSFFFGSKGHNRALAYLRYGLQQKEGFIVITGTPGTGKTTLSRALLQEIGRDKVIVAELNTTHLEAHDVLRMVTASFGLEFENAPKATLLKRMESYFISRYRAGYHILLIIDEAQNLPFESIEELRMLSNFYIGKNALIQIFLLGQEQFRERLYSKDLEQLRQRVVASCHLEPLNQQETRDYIEHRLTLVGWKKDPQISDRAYARIFTLTKGIPRRINTFCDRLFLYGSLDDIHLLKDDHVKDVARELMYEVSAKDVKLSDIKAETSDPEKSDSDIDTETLDSEQLGSFSDDVPEVAVPEAAMPEAVPSALDAGSNSESDSESDKQVTQQTKKDDSNTSSVNTSSAHTSTDSNERQTLRVVSNNNMAVESLEPMPMNVADRLSVENKPDWWKLLALVVDYYQNPETHVGLNNSRNALPDGVNGMLKVAAGKKIIPVHMRIDEMTAVSDETIKRASINYVKNVLLTSKANYYRRLGVDREASLEHIRTNYRYLFRVLQSEQEQDTNEQAEMYIRRINQAFSTLRSADKRKEYDEFLATIDNKKLEENVVYEELNQAAEISDKDLTETQLDENINIPSVARKGKSSIVYWFVLFVTLLVGGAGAFYYLQPKFGEIKSKISMFFPELKSQGQVKSIDRLPKQENLLNGEALSAPFTEPPMLEPVELEVESELEPEPEPEPEPMELSLAPELKAPELKIPELKIPEPVKEKQKQKIVKSATAVKPEVAMISVKAKPAVPEKPKLVKKIEVVEIEPTPIPKKDAEMLESIPKPVPVSLPLPVPKLEPAHGTVEKVTEAVASPVKSAISKKVLMSENELSAFMSRFSLSYEEGELDAFMALFSKDALTNNDENWNSIRKDYKSLFDSTEMRVIELDKMVWNQVDALATGEGKFVVTVLRRGGAKVQKFTGRIKLEVVKPNEKLLIKGMFHVYSNDDS